MRAVRRKDTGPEKAIRGILTGLGIRYRLHRKDLPGTPDIVFPAKRKVIFVNGCFWHGHYGCPKGRPPSTRVEYWLPKISKNIANDLQNLERLERLGWRSLTIWQCELLQPKEVENKLRSFLKAAAHI